MPDTDISGTVFDEFGSPQAGATVALMLTESESEVFYTTTNSNGDYQFVSHPDADGSTKEWHVVGYYRDNDGEYNGFSEPYVSASLAPTNIGAFGGDSIFIETLNGTQYKIHEFVTDGTFTVTKTPPGEKMDVLIVGAGGGGGASSSTTAGGGGGGAGGVISTTLDVEVATTAITVGSGGAGATADQDSDGQNGGNTEAFGLTSLGGGGGGGRGRPGLDGGCGGGGGSGSEQPGGVGLQSSEFVVVGSTTDGGDGEERPLSSSVNNAAGGGGSPVFAGLDGTTNAGGAGADSIDVSSEFGTRVGVSGRFAAGGGGGDGNIPDSERFVSGGVGGGGDAGKDAAPNNGSGGGGQRFSGTSPPGDGGSGVVLIRYEI